MERKAFLKKLGKRIVDIRIKKGYSQAELAHRCEKDPQAMERIENAKVNPTVFTLHIIAQALECKEKELFEF